MYVCGIKIARNYAITPDDTGMPPSNTTNIKVSLANISLRLLCKQIMFITGGKQQHAACFACLSRQWIPQADVKTRHHWTRSIRGDRTSKKQLDLKALVSPS